MSTHTQEEFDMLYRTHRVVALINFNLLDNQRRY